MAGGVAGREPLFSEEVWVPPYGNEPGRWERTVDLHIVETAFWRRAETAGRTRADVHCQERWSELHGLLWAVGKGTWGEYLDPAYVEEELDRSLRGIER